MSPFLFMEIDILKSKIGSLVEGFLKEDYEDAYFMVGMDLSASALCRVYIDGVEPVKYEVCRKLSRHLESYLDENLWLGEKYKLEVSSPGADKPLTDPRQFTKHVGRSCELQEVSGNIHAGKLIKVEEDQVTLETKNKKEIAITLENIESIKIVLSFKK